MKITGIYKIQSLIKPERFYIGSSINIQNRWTIHLSNLKKNKHHSKKLQYHYNKYGIDDLQFSILIVCEKNELISNEQIFLDQAKPFFNNRIIAESNLGYKFGSEARNNMSKAKRGIPKTAEHNRKNSESQLGRIFSETHKQNMRKPKSEIGKQNMKISWHKRKPVSEETKGKLSLKRCSDDVKLKISKSLEGNQYALGKRWTLTEEKKEHRRLMRIQNKLNKAG